MQREKDESKSFLCAAVVSLGNAVPVINCLLKGVASFLLYISFSCLEPEQQFFRNFWKKESPFLKDKVCIDVGYINVNLSNVAYASKVLSWAFKTGALKI